MTDITHASNADGAVDYSHYSEEQLFRVLRRIDAEKFPLNFVKLKAAFAARQIPIEQYTNASDALMAAERVVYSRPEASASSEIRIAFAPKPGFLTWLGPSRNDFRFVGYGNIAVHGTSVFVEGRRFGFIMGLPLRRRVELKLGDIFNVEHLENVVRFECRFADGKSKALTFWLVDSATAEKLVGAFPAEKSPDYVPQLPAYLDFEEQLETRAPHLPATYSFAVLCLLMFAVTISHGAEWFKSTGVVEIAWGSNFGPMTSGGQWWRLFTYSLLHFGVFHLVFNLWALISFGAVAERLYGSLRYTMICLVAGVAGGMTSIAMQPDVNSAGASAVIFGIFGALLVAHLRGTEAIPASVRRSLRKSTMFFVLVTLAGGLVFQRIDNAAHIGGLVAGTCMGLAFHSPRRFVRIAAPAALAVLIVLAGAGLARRAANTPHVEVQYWENMRWFLSGERRAVENWSELQRLAAAEQIDDDSMARRLDTEVAPFWREASKRFQPLKFDAGSEMFDTHQYMLALTNGRLHAIELCISGMQKHDVGIVTACMKEMGEGDALIHERQKKLENGK